ncbi:MAG: hypothetical protein GF334_10845 [Candidatus Altiarchaeales archaeon]|nr:hypothetical protein [Candidatus Altiarchaeales archaeon]
MKNSKKFLYILLALLLIQSAYAVIVGIVCPIILAIQNTLLPIAGGLVTLMFVYGGLTYVFNADNPGGRKKAKDILIHSIIGGIIVVVAFFIVGLINGLTNCGIALP